MNKRLFIWIVILMAISLPGNVVVLFYWFNNPMKMNDAFFDRLVKEALNSAVDKIQNNQDIRIINKGLPHDTLQWDQKNLTPPKSGIIQPVIKDTIKGSKNESPKKDISTKEYKKIVFNDANANSPRETRSEFKNDTLHTRNNSVHNNTSTEQKMTGLNKAQKKKLQQLQLLTERFNSRNKDWERGRPIDVIKLIETVKEELIKGNISTDFNFAIFSSDSIIKTDLKKPIKPNWYRVKLFPDDIFSRDLYFGICFPIKETFFYRIPFLLPGLSLIFSLIIFVTYVLSILIISRQRRLSAMKTDFINHMTHEFKTPITTIGLAVESIMNQETINDEERVRFYSNMISKENQRLNEQVERILQAARFDRKELYFKFQEVQVHDLIRETIHGISIQIEKRGGRIVTKLDAENPVILTDTIHFTNIVRNLLDNANKYSPDSPDILVSTYNDQKGLYMSVEDKGIGISKRVQTKIFNKFYRLTYGNLHNIKGFGLGLSYIKAILKINKGNIKVYSEPGRGSRFVVFIPFKL